MCSPLSLSNILKQLYAYSSISWQKLFISLLFCPKLLQHRLSHRRLPTESADPLYCFHYIGYDYAWVPSDDMMFLMLRGKEDVLDLLQCLALCLGHHEKHVDEAACNNAAKHEEEPRLANGLLNVGPDDTLG